MKPQTRARIGLLPTGHHYYWEQYPRLKQMGLRMYDKLLALLEPMADLVAPELVDTPEKSREAGALFAREAVDMVLVFPFGYTPSMDMLPALASYRCPRPHTQCPRGQFVRLWDRRHHRIPAP